MFVCCFLACTDYLGVENGDIPDANFNASHAQGSAYNARLNEPSAWRVDGSTSGPWIQVDIGYSTNVTGLLTQGKRYSSPSSENWITKLKVSTFTTTADDELFFSGSDGRVKVNISYQLYNTVIIR